MKCPKCVDENTPSKVYSDGGSKTLMGGGGPFWDEQDEYHVHDPNRVTREFHCSFGHIWSIAGLDPCPNEKCPRYHTEQTTTQYDQLHWSVRKFPESSNV
jgi:hypothetical protein